MKESRPGLRKWTLWRNMNRQDAIPVVSSLCSVGCIFCLQVFKRIVLGVAVMVAFKGLSTSFPSLLWETIHTYSLIPIPTRDVVARNARPGRCDV